MIFVGDPEMTDSKLTRIVKFVSPMICSKKNLPRWPAFEFSSWILEVINFGSQMSLGFRFCYQFGEVSSGEILVITEAIWEFCMISRMASFSCFNCCFFFGGKFWKPVWKFVGGTDHKAGKINHKPTFCCLKMPEARPCWSCVVMKKLLGSCVLTLCFLGLPRPWSCLRIRRIFGGQYFFLRWRFASPRKVIS